MPHQAALHVVLWYARRYGAGWQRAIRRPRTGGHPPWRVWRLRTGGYAAAVWERGSRVEVCGVRRNGRAAARFDSLANTHLALPAWTNPGRRLVFATAARARAAVRAWVRRRWGKAAAEVVYR